MISKASRQSSMQLVRVMQALGDQTRFKMFQILMQDKQLCVSEIAQKLDISIPAASQHFRTFELIGLVHKQRFGQKVCYQLQTDSPLVNKISKLVKEEV